MKKKGNDQTNFLIAISPDGRIESIDIFGDRDGTDSIMPENLFKAKVHPSLLRPSESRYHLMVSVFEDGRFTAFRSSETSIEDWDINWHKSQYQKLLHAYMAPNSRAISDVEIAPDDVQAGEKLVTVRKMGEILPIRPIASKTWRKPKGSATAPANGATPSKQLGKFAGWFGNARGIPLLKDDGNFVEKKAALEAAGFSYSQEENLWTRP